MKKFLPVILAVAGGLLMTASCNKGDDNPYGDWRCTCFVTKAMKQDTVIVFEKDTAILIANDMDKESAKAFCETTKQSFVDTLGSAALCNLK
jgi:uncharacterized protein (DUF697 family)